MVSAVFQTPTRHKWSPLHALCAATWALNRVQVRRQPVSRSVGRWAREKQRNISIVGSTSAVDAHTGEGMGVSSYLFPIEL